MWLELVKMLEVKSLGCRSPGGYSKKSLEELTVVKDVTVEVANRRRPGGGSWKQSELEEEVEQELKMVVLVVELGLTKGRQ